MAANNWVPGPTRAFYAGGTIANRRFVVRSGANVVQASTAGTVPAVGVARHEATADQEIDVFTLPGTAVALEAGGAFAVGDRITFDSQGRAVIANATTMYVCGIADEASTGAGKIALVTLVSPHKYAA